MTAVEPGEVRLTEAEKQLLADRVLGGASPSSLMVRAVERILADRLAARPAEGGPSEVDRVACLLMDEWKRVEGKRVNVSYVATFADMARAVVADRAARSADEDGLRAAIEALADDLRATAADAEAAMKYHAEIDNGIGLAAEQMRKYEATNTARRLRAVLAAHPDGAGKEQT